MVLDLPNNNNSQKGRAGTTSVTSVSLSPEFRALMDTYNLSPTECMRRGIAVSLFDMGIGEFKSETNEKRSSALSQVLEDIERDGKKIQEFSDFWKLIRDSIKIQENNIEKLKGILDYKEKLGKK